MSLVIAAPELVQSAAQDLAGIGSSLSDAATKASVPTTGIAAAAGDEVSTAIAAAFGNFGRQFQALNTQAQVFHVQFVNALNASAESYTSAEFTSAQGLGVPAASSTPAQALDAFGAAVAAPYQALGSRTAANAQIVFAASLRAANNLSDSLGALSRGLHANPAAVFGNVQTALQSVTLIGAPDNVVSAVTNHTLGGVTQALGGLLGDTMVYDAHNEVFAGIHGDGFELPSGPVGALTSGVADVAASPLSGVLLGAIGPVVSPSVALFNEAGAIFGDLTGTHPSPSAALVRLIDTPATVVDAFFNGATLNLDPLAPLVQSLFFSSNEGGTGEVITGLSFGFGGLFSPGQVVTGAAGPMYYGVGGSALNSLGMDLAFFPPDADAGATIAIPANPVGPIGAAAGLLDIFAQALGGTLLG